MIKSLLILAFECLVFDGVKKAPPTQTSLRNRGIVSQVGGGGVGRRWRAGFIHEDNTTVLYHSFVSINPPNNPEPTSTCSHTHAHTHAGTTWAARHHCDWFSVYLSPSWVQPLNYKTNIKQSGHLTQRAMHLIMSEQSRLCFLINVSVTEAMNNITRSMLVQGCAADCSGV